jgi:hypothetical protein
MSASAAPARRSASIWWAGFCSAEEQRAYPISMP